VDAKQQVLDAATARAHALADGDPNRLGGLLHAQFRWTSHTGENFDRTSYIQSNTGGATVWRSQVLGEPEVIVVDNVAVLRTIVEDVIEASGGEGLFQMPVTQVWIRTEQGWKCLAGHAGPRQPD